MPGFCTILPPGEVPVMRALLMEGERKELGNDPKKCGEYHKGSGSCLHGFISCSHVVNAHYLFPTDMNPGIPSIFAGETCPELW
jgi:hypothetical protein